MALNPRLPSNSGHQNLSPLWGYAWAARPWGLSLCGSIYRKLVLTTAGPLPRLKGGGFLRPSSPYCRPSRTHRKAGAGPRPARSQVASLWNARGLPWLSLPHPVTCRWGQTVPGDKWLPGRRENTAKQRLPKHAGPDPCSARPLLLPPSLGAKRLKNPGGSRTPPSRWAGGQVSRWAVSVGSCVQRAGHNPGHQAGELGPKAFPGLPPPGPMGHPDAHSAPRPQAPHNSPWSWPALKRVSSFL